MRGYAIATLVAVGLLATGCKSSPDSAQPQKAMAGAVEAEGKALDEAPAEEAAEEEAEEAAAKDELGVAPEPTAGRGAAAACETPECEEACEDYTAEEAAKCADAWSKGCFGDEIEDGYDCGEFGADEGGEKAKRKPRKRKAPTGKPGVSPPPSPSPDAVDDGEPDPAEKPDPMFDP